MKRDLYCSDPVFIPVKIQFWSKFEQNLEKRVFCLYIGRFFYCYRYLNKSCGRDLDFNAHWLLWSFSVSYSLLTTFKLVSSMVWGKKPHSPHPTSIVEFQTRFPENGLKLKKLASKSFSEAKNWLRPCKYYSPQTHVTNFWDFDFYGFCDPFSAEK